MTTPTRPTADQIAEARKGLLHLHLTVTDEGVVRPFTEHELWPVRPPDLLPDGVQDQIVQVNGWLYFITADGSLEAFDSRDPRYIPQLDEYDDDLKPNPACRHFGGTGIGCPDCEAEDRENAEIAFDPYMERAARAVRRGGR